MRLVASHSPSLLEKTEAQGSTQSGGCAGFAQAKVFALKVRATHRLLCLPTDSFLGPAAEQSTGQSVCRAGRKALCC